jgi:uncharacterized surface protein with fasciclin (FAS1) repeats
MRSRTTARLAGFAAAAVAATGLGVATTAPAQAADGNKPLVEVLGADGARFDNNPRDFDIVEAAVLAVLDAKPRSPLGLIAKGNQRLTVFLPSDGAFRKFVEDLTGATPRSERAVFNRTAGIAGDIDTLETVLLYHVKPSRTLVSEHVVARAAADASTRMANGGRLGFTTAGGKIRLVDADPNNFDARVFAGRLDINRGNKQVAHGISRVLRPLDL